MTRHALWMSLALGASCHLIGGAGDILFHGAVGGGGSGAGGGAGGCACDNPCEKCNSDNICERLPEGTPCQDSGECTASGLCVEGAVEWVRSFGGERDDVATAVLSLGGEVFVAGTYNSNIPPLSFDGMQHADPDGADDSFMLRLSAGDGAVVWSDNFTTEVGPQRIEAAALDGRGGVLTAGYYDIAVGYEPINSPGMDPTNQKAFVIDADVVEGTGVWGWITHATMNSEATAARAVAASGNRVAVAGEGGLNFDAVPGDQVSLGAFAVWVALIENHDSFQMGRVPAIGANWVECTASPVVSDVVFDALDGIWVVGELTAAGCMHNVVTPPTMGTASFLLRYEVGNMVVSTAPDEVINYNGEDDPTTAVHGRALVANGSDVYVAGHFIGLCGIGGGTAGNTGPGNDAFVALEGVSPWLRTFDASAGVEINDMARDSHGYLVIVGTLLAGSTFTLDPDDPEKNVASQSSNPLIFKLDPNGVPVWARTIQVSNPAAALSVAIDADDHILVAGRTAGNMPDTIDPHVAGDDIFVLKMTP